ANPEEIQGIFEHTFYENDFGTVGIVLDTLEEKIKNIKEKIANIDVSQENRETIDKFKKELVSCETLKNIEITPYRTESNYSDNRRPDEIKFSKNIQDDLKRRDFTINALAYNPTTKELIDNFEGISDLGKKIIRTVGDPDERFNEDGLRIMRAVRFSAQLNFEIEEKTLISLQKNSILLKNISLERIRDEFNKIIMSKNPEKGLNVSHETNILQYFLPELEENIGVIQGGAHVYDVYNHLLKALQAAADRDYPLTLRLASLLHDIGKGRTAEWSDKKQGNTFFSHE
ncbi:MAG TPA: polynucleotide adenylyltransferase, partial [Bacteroidia bacterium]|nr:polynucleotide adenylyltransferase [Bacteroidia bacterium]